jgi:uncharacterized protein with ATP-grasp and redox domains
MRTYIDCVPCFLRQALEASRMATGDEWVQARILRRVLREVADFSFQLTPPHMGQIIHRIVREESGNDDPYRREKFRLNRSAADHYARMRPEVASSLRPRDFALRLAVAGNIIDFGPPGTGSPPRLRDVIESAEHEDLAIDHRADFWTAVEKANRILYLGDNAGEVYFDRLLLEYLPADRVTLVVRGGPIINDITVNDLNGSGLQEMVTIIDNGSDAPGTILSDCSAEFREKYEAADLLISKGQGNYETLSGMKGKRIFYLLKAKCPVLAGDLGVPQGSLIVKGVGPAPS